VQKTTAWKAACNNRCWHRKTRAALQTKYFGTNADWGWRTLILYCLLLEGPTAAVTVCPCRCNAPFNNYVTSCARSCCIAPVSRWWSRV